MEDFPHGRTLFWAGVAAFLLLAAVPSAVLIETVDGYVRFLSGWDPGALAVLRTHRVPHRETPTSGGASPKVYFIEFRLHAPRARRVRLAGDFNRWRPETLPLQREGGGPWEVLVALPPGRYQYLFEVDGAWTRDPAARESGRRGETETSVRSVP